VICALATSAALAQPSHRTAVQFGDETVELKFSNIAGDERMEELRNLTNEATDPTKREDLWRVRWEDYGEAIALQALADFHLRRGDLVAAYAHLYAVDKIAKWYTATVTTDFKPAPGTGRWMPPGQMMKAVFADIENDLKLVGSKMTADQRAEGVRQAATLIRNNANCCTLVA
jgi:hypothetical protein